MNKIEKLKNKYENVISEYIDIFSEKQGLELEHWVGNDIGGIACFSDVFLFNFSDIVFDINTNQKKGLIIKWLYDSLDNEGKSINYYSYSKGLRFSDLK